MTNPSRRGEPLILALGAAQGGWCVCLVKGIRELIKEIGTQSTGMCDGEFLER